MSNDGGRWRRIYSNEWHASAFKGLSDAEKVVYFYARTGPQSDEDALGGDEDSPVVLIMHCTDCGCDHLWKVGIEEGDDCPVCRKLSESERT